MAQSGRGRGVPREGDTPWDATPRRRDPAPRCPVLMPASYGRGMGRPTPKCPVRNEPCTLCVPGADGPHNCGLVWLVKDDPDLAEQFAARARTPKRPASATAQH